METQISNEILHDFAPRIRVYKDGRVERLLKDENVPASYDPKTRVQSKDVSLSPGVSARIYLPDTRHLSEDTKLPLLIYIHGGAFCLYSASSSIYQTYLNSLTALANCVTLSVDYRIAPEHPMPACYDDAWDATQWALAMHDPWLARWADTDKVYLAGDSAGANIAHDVVVRAGSDGPKFAGLAMVHPFFGGDEVNELWNYLYPTTTGLYDPKLNPMVSPDRMRGEMKACKRVLVCVGGKDFLKDRGVAYYDVLRDWDGEVEYMESKGRGHVFYLYKPDCDEALELMQRVATFIK